MLGGVDATPIAEIESGARVRVAGRVRQAAPSPLRSKLSDRECVYWDVRADAADAPLESDAQDFWVEDATGRALVRAGALSVRLRQHRREDYLEQIVSDVDAVGVRIRELKDQLREQGPDHARLTAERRRLAKVATLLCAMRAEANGNVHLGGNANGQRAWIERNAHLADDGPGAASVKMRVKRRVERLEVALEVGQRVEVEGFAEVTPVPAGYGGTSGGYRTAPTCLTLRADERPVLVLGVGEAAPAPREAPPARTTAAPSPRPAEDAGVDPRLYGLLAVTLLLAALSFLITRG
ncbi:MAG: hypothetical protein SangKO_056800 [Sandaracinaceae bacterium]